MRFFVYKLDAESFPIPRKPRVDFERAAALTSNVQERDRTMERACAAALEASSRDHG